MQNTESDHIFIFLIMDILNLNFSFFNISGAWITVAMI